MLNYDTIPFKNPDIDIFIGRWEGYDFEVKPGEKRYFPSFLSQHFAKQLIEKMLSKVSPKDKSLNKEAFKQEMMEKILEPEMNTFSSSKNLTFKEIVLEHERQVKEMLIEKGKMIRKQEIEVLDILSKIKEEEK